MATAGPAGPKKRGGKKGAPPPPPPPFRFESHEAAGTTVALVAADAAALRVQAEQYVDSSASSDEGALWPLVRRVRLSGPWAVLAGGAVLVDAPGLRDDNSARDAVVKSRLRGASALWFVSNVRRAVNDKTVKDCLPTSFRSLLAETRRAGDAVEARARNRPFGPADDLRRRRGGDATGLHGIFTP